MVPKISQEDLGVALGITFQQIQKYEKGVNRMSAAMMVQIAAVLKVRRPVFFR
jgi:transcriptional regulator with XRE-family HTH domain